MRLLVFGACSSLFAIAVAAGRPGTGASKAEEDRQAIEQIENEWLEARDVATLERILADDFVHPVPSGDFLDKARHIAWYTRHPRPPGVESHFGDLRVRFYGGVAIANGTVLTSEGEGRGVSRGVFTDVFVLQNGRWRAVNAQENEVVPWPPPSPRQSALEPHGR